MVDIDKLPEGSHKLKKIYVYCQGLKKRDRKIKNHSFLLGYFEPSVNVDQFEETAKTFIREKMNTLYKPQFEISLQDTEIKIQGDMRIERFSCYDIFDREKKVYDFSL